MVVYVAREGIPISRDRVRKLMRCRGLRAIYQKPRTTIAGEPSERFRCLVEFNEIKSVVQVWATEVTYVPLRKGFLYLVAVVDLFSRLDDPDSEARPAGSHCTPASTSRRTSARSSNACAAL